nr:DUF397 domain-containing protein [Streptomyces sp. Amel2xC10]
MRDTAPTRIWIKSSYSGHNNNCMEFLTPRRVKPLSATRRSHTTE